MGGRATSLTVGLAAPADLPVNTTAPSVTGSGYQGLPLRCNHGEWNAAAEQLLGWSRTEAIGNPLHDFVVAPEHRDATGTLAPPGSGAASILDTRVEVRAQCRDGRTIPVELTVWQADELAVRLLGLTLLELWERRRETIGAAYEAGVQIYAGTDAGGVLPHGLIASEVIELTSYGLSAHDALGAASWRAREWLGLSGTLEEGSEADFVVYATDPLDDLAILRVPRRIVLRGTVVG